jgi:hypothetical protein
MKYIIIAGIAILIIFLAVLSQIPLGIEPLTEIYFENHTKLPINIFLNESYDYSFTIHNLEYQEMEYNYTVLAEYNTTIVELDKGVVVLEDNTSITYERNFSMNEPFKRARIEVVVVKTQLGEPEFKKKLWWNDPNYAKVLYIHFWVDEIRGPEVIIVYNNETNVTSNEINGTGNSTDNVNVTNVVNSTSNSTFN